eukprot:Rhum_TRINITY_DN13573_c1_g2::Rhum_TRINITY_DN13573_c1_g2_i1::g.60677::m.60677
MTTIEEMDKTLRGLRKKITECEELQKKQKGKEKLTDAQKDKIKKKASFEKEFKELKDKMARAKMGDIDETPAEVVPEPAATNGSQKKSKKKEPEPEPEKPKGPTKEEVEAKFDVEIQKIQTKLDEIKALKEKKKEGATLDAAQQAKVKKHQELSQDKNRLLQEKKSAVKALEDEAKKAAKSPERAAAAPADDGDDEEDDDEETDNPLRADRTQLRKLYEALDKAQDMKRKIAMGRVKKPSPPQQMLANQFDMLTKAVATEEARIEEEEKRLRREAGLPEVEEVELTPEEARLAEVEEEMKAAAEKMDFAEAARLKAIFDRLKAGLPEEEEAVEEPEPEVEPEVEAEPEVEPEAEAAPAEEEEKAEEEPVPEPEVEP